MPSLSVRSVRKPTLPDITIMLSNRDISGNPVVADDGSYNPQFSPDGNFVAFWSHATNLGGDPAVADVFLRDLRTGAVSLIGIGQGPDAPVPNGNSSHPRFGPDPDNPFMVFLSSATNLVVGPTDGNNANDIFLKDLRTGAVSLVSIGQGPDAPAADRGSYMFSLSRDKPYVAFASSATNLIAGRTDGNTLPDIFLKDLDTGEVRLLSIAPGENAAPADGVSDYPEISADGNFVVFQSTATNLDGGGATTMDIFRKNLLTGEIELVSTGPGEGASPADKHSFRPQISADGRYVLFTSEADNLAGGAANTDDIFLKDMETGEVTLVSQSAAGVPGDGDSFSPRFSPDGRFVIFDTDAGNLIPGVDTISAVVMKEIATGEVRLVAENGINAQFSPDGRRIVFESESGNLVEGDTNDAVDVFMTDLLYRDNRQAIAEGRFMEVKLAVGAASRVSIAWGDGAASSAVPFLGTALLEHAYAAPGPKNAVVTIVEGAQTWRVPYRIDTASSQMLRNTGLADTLSGGTGSDVLSGSSYANRLYGNAGNDRLSAGSGNDTAYGGSGHDRLYGSSGYDRLSGDAGNDTLYGGTYNDTLYGGTGYDKLYGDSGNDRLYGGTYNDLLYGGSGYDRLSGDSGNDLLDGGTSNDSLYGGAGNDKLHGGLGKDVLVGGSGRDVFVFTTKPSASNVDKVTDYNRSYDTVQLDNKYMPKLGGTGRLSSSKFVLGPKAKDANDHLIYDRTKGTLYYDADGSGSAYKQVLIAHFTNKALLTAGEFIVI